MDSRPPPPPPQQAPMGGMGDLMSGLMGGLMGGNSINGDPIPSRKPPPPPQKNKDNLDNILNNMNLDVDNIDLDSVSIISGDSDGKGFTLNL